MSDGETKHIGNFHLFNAKLILNVFLDLQDVYFDDESAEVVISSLRLGDDQGRSVFLLLLIPSITLAFKNVQFKFFC